MSGFTSGYLASKSKGFFGWTLRRVTSQDPKVSTLVSTIRVGNGSRTRRMSGSVRMLLGRVAVARG